MSFEEAIGDGLKRSIDRWLQSSGLNEFGDPPGTVYTGGNPLFDERRATPRDRYAYILSRHPGLRQRLEAQERNS